MEQEIKFRKNFFSDKPVGYNIQLNKIKDDIKTGEITELTEDNVTEILNECKEHILCTAERAIKFIEKYLVGVKDYYIGFEITTESVIAPFSTRLCVNKGYLPEGFELKAKDLNSIEALIEVAENRVYVEHFSNNIIGLHGQYFISIPIVYHGDTLWCDKIYIDDIIDRTFPDFIEMCKMYMKDELVDNKEESIGGDEHIK